MIKKSVTGEYSFFQSEIADKMIGTIRTDSEAFPRREAAMLLKECWELFESDSTRDEIYLILSTVVPKDFDWEVKLAAIQFWKKIACLCKCISDSEHCSTNGDIKSDGENSHTFVVIGGLQTLLELSEDYDDSVKEMAVQTLHDIRENGKLLSSDCIREENLDKRHKDILRQFQDLDTSAKLSVFKCSKTEGIDDYLCLLDDILSYKEEKHDIEDNAADCY